MGTHEDVAFAGVTAIAAKTRSGEVTAREVTDFFLDRIARFNPELNAFITVLADEARADADALDTKAQRGEELGPLHGVPIAIKAENDVAGIPTTFGGAAFTTPARADSAVVARLRAAGAVIVGTTAMPEFGIWPYTESVANGATRNPWNTAYSPAGSSGGTAAAVAAGLVPAAIGGDGGGSIRLPAAWCGLFGLKPQRGRVSAAPNASLWGALGTIGPLTRYVEDTALILDCVGGGTEGVDKHVAQALPTTLMEALQHAPGRLRIGVSTAAPLGTVLKKPARQAVETTAEALKDVGHDVFEHDFSYPPALALSFVPQYLNGFSEEAHMAEHPELLERRTRRGVRLGKVLGLTSPKMVRKAEAKSAEIGEKLMHEVFSDVDLLLTPSVPHPAVPIGQLDAHGFLPAALKASGVASFTSPWNAVGNPAAAVPAGFHEGLPLSAQLVGPFNSEPLLCQVSHQLQVATNWPALVPPQGLEP